MKKIIKSLTVAVVVGGALAAGQSAFAQGIFVKNDLYMGFQNGAGGGTADYIVNMGPASSIVGGSTVVPLSSDFSIGNFKSAALQGTNSSTVYGGVIGATNTTSTGSTQPPADIYVTQVRLGGAGNPALPGSTAPGGLTHAQDNSSESTLNTLDGPAPGTGGVLDSSRTWEADVEPTLGSGSFYGEVGANPDSSVTTANVAYEDLWETTNNAFFGAQPFIYLGYFTIDFTGSSAAVSFTPKSAPAPLTNPDITSVTYSGTTVTLTWTTLPPHAYQLQYTTSLNSPVTWNNVGGSLAASTTTLTESDTAASGPHRYYRVTGQ